MENGGAAAGYHLNFALFAYAASKKKNSVNKQRLTLDGTGDTRYSANFL
jgi:hypothetical protein